MPTRFTTIFQALRQRVGASLGAARQRLLAFLKPATGMPDGGALSDLARTKAELVAENAFLRHQLGILRRSVKRPRCTPTERALRVLLLARRAPDRAVGHAAALAPAGVLPRVACPVRCARLLQGPGELACLLRHPGRGRVGRAAREMDPTCADLEKEEAIDHLEEQRLDGEEVAGEEMLPMLREELPPGAGALAAQWCWRDPMALEDIADRRAPEGVAEFGHLALESTIAPARILPG